MKHALETPDLSLVSRHDWRRFDNTAVTTNLHHLRMHRLEILPGRIRFANINGLGVELATNPLQKGIMLLMPAGVNRLANSA